MRAHIPLLFLSVLFFTANPVYVQGQKPGTDTTAKESDDLMSLLEEQDAGEPKKKEYTTATFKTTRITSGHSIETTGKGVLDSRISHRFGAFNDGLENFFGLDNATTRIGFDYGISDRLSIGIGRSTYQKEYDGFFKLKILRQTTDNKMPLSLNYVGGASATSIKVTVPAGQEYLFTNRLAYMNQILAARKFNDKLSLQLMPTHFHYNLVQYKDEPNDVLAMGVGGRVKLTSRMSVSFEYYYQLEEYKLRGTKNALSLSLDLETGGHVFQLIFSNATGITERTVIGQTINEWGEGEIHFGFNISRVFTIVKPRDFKNSRNKIY